MAIEENIKNLASFEMRVWRRTLKMSWRDRVPNEKGLRRADEDCKTVLIR